MVVKSVGAEESTAAVTGLRAVFSFPHPVNEVAARSVAGMVMALSLVIILTDLRWLMFLLAYGFLARVLTGPTLSPMGLLATRVIAPKLLRHTKLVAGPPKQFVQSVGLVFAAAALVLSYGFGQHLAAEAVLGTLVLFAGLESILGFCTGCFVFGYLMRWGVVPRETCERCSNLSLPATPADA